MDHVRPSLISYLPTQNRVSLRRGVHLVICIHGLQEICICTKYNYLLQGVYYAYTQLVQPTVN